MARRKKKTTTPATDITPARVFVVALLIIIALAAYVWFTQRRRPRTTATTTSSTPAPNIDRGMAYAGLPRPLDPSLHLQVLVNQAYEVGYSNQREDPLWVAYKLQRRVPLLDIARPHVDFDEDPRTAARVSTHDYTRSGFSRGHMAPSHAIGAFFGRAAQLETFRMSNIVPQLQVVNAGTWENLENLEIAYAEEFGTVWVVDGPVFGPHPATLRAGVTVPQAFYKLLIRETDGRPEVLAVIVPQAGPRAATTGKEPPAEYLTTVDRVQQITRLDFMPELPDDDERQVEAAVPRGMWPPDPQTTSR